MILPPMSRNCHHHKIININLLPITVTHLVRTINGLIPQVDNILYQCGRLSLWFYLSMVKIISKLWFHHFQRSRHFWSFTVTFDTGQFQGEVKQTLFKSKKESICNHRLNFPLDPSLSDWDMIKPDMDPEPSSSNGSNPDFYLLKLVLNEPVCWCTGTVRKCTKLYQLVPKNFQIAIFVLTLYRCDTGLKHELLILERIPALYITL